MKDRNLQNIRHIDILDIGNDCNQNCKQCFYNTVMKTKETLSNELHMIDDIKNNNNLDENIKFFIYPKEITTTPKLIKTIAENGQKFILTNAKNIKTNSDIFKTLKENNIKKIKITLFPNEDEQLFRNWNTAWEYNDIKEVIKMAVNEGIKVKIFTMITPENIRFFQGFYREADNLHISEIELLNFIPTGNGKNMDMKYAMKATDLEKLLSITNDLKLWKWPYISYGFWFWPNFYGKSIYKFIEKGQKHDWVTTEYPCPTINNLFLWISLKNKWIYRCFKLLSESEAKIWEVNNNGKINLYENVDFDENILKEKLRWICSKDSCNFQNLCLWWCRSNAYILAKKRGEKEPEYAGQEICITNLIQKRIS